MLIVDCKSGNKFQFLRNVTKLVPSLNEVQNCSDVPQEVCELICISFFHFNTYFQGLFQSKRQATEGEETHSEEMVLQLPAQHNPPARIWTNAVQKIMKLC